MATTSHCTILNVYNLYLKMPGTLQIDKACENVHRPHKQTSHAVVCPP